MNSLDIALAALAAVLAVSGFLLGRGREKTRQRREREAAKDEASQILKRAREEADTLRESTLLQGKEEVFVNKFRWVQAGGAFFFRRFRFRFTAAFPAFLARCRESSCFAPVCVRMER